MEEKSETRRPGPMKIGIIDYGMGNIRSVFHAFEAIGASVEICSSPQHLVAIDRLVLPGVGAFPDCMKNLTTKGFLPVLNDLVLKRKTPILGICLGMQAMADRGFEGGETSGLGWIKGSVRQLVSTQSFRVPHVGWEEILSKKTSALFSGLNSTADFYFVHSFHLVCEDESDVEARCVSGSSSFVAAIRRGNIWATQFHPEKSQEKGLRLLRNFLECEAERE
jgi:imidazole glycerol-phosphate synthase subunit HisH